jgi:hypothetical protein
MPTLALEVVTELPQRTALVVPADVLIRTEALSTKLKGLVAIGNTEEADDCASIMREARDLRKALDARRLETKRPLLDLEAKIDATAAGPMAALKAIDTQASDRLRVWEMAEQRRREEAERGRQAELRRIEAERLKLEQDRIDREIAERKRQKEEAEAEARRKQAAEAPPQEDLPFEPAEEPAPPAALAADDDMALLADQEAANREAQLARQEEALKAKPAAIIRPSGISFRETLKFTVLNIAALPSKYVIRTIDDAAIRKDFCAGFNARQPLPVLPGVQFFIQKDPINSNRR